MTDGPIPPELTAVPAPPAVVLPQAAASALPAAERATAWIAYGCFALGLVMDWPALIGLVLCYARRSAPDAGAMATHYRALIETFWTALALGLASLALLVTGMWPLLREARATGHDLDRLLDLSTMTVYDWVTLQTPISLASVGALALVCTYLWLAYRIGRGALRLAAGRPAS